MQTIPSSEQCKFRSVPPKPARTSQRSWTYESKNRARRQRNEQVSSWLTAVEGFAEVHDPTEESRDADDDAVAIIREKIHRTRSFTLTRLMCMKTHYDARLLSRD